MSDQMLMLRFEPHENMEFILIHWFHTSLMLLIRIKLFAACSNDRSYCVGLEIKLCLNNLMVKNHPV
jgi:hypothetical protein